MAILTKRQRAVVELAAQGKTSDDIAHVLGLSRRTVETHLGNSMKALSAPNRTAAVVLAIHHHEIALDEIVEAIQGDD